MNEWMNILLKRFFDNAVMKIAHQFAHVQFIKTTYNLYLIKIFD